MSWLEFHSESEKLAMDAAAARRKGDFTTAEQLYDRAAQVEVSAFLSLPPEKQRTRGITAVSVTALAYKARNFHGAQQFACQCLASSDLPAFAVAELQGLLQTIWSEQEMAAAGLKFSKQDVFFAVRGGEVLTGGAPMDLILQKVQQVQTFIFRTVEYLMDRPLRMRGMPDAAILGSYRPWLLHAPPSSYQFAVRIESSHQLELGFVPSKAAPEADQVADKVLEIINSAVTSPEEAMIESVPDGAYRSLFLKLARSLAPTGKRFAELEIRSDLRRDSIKLLPDGRNVIQSAIDRNKAPVPSIPHVAGAIKLAGTLRAVHLDKDWLEVVSLDGKPVKVEKAGDAIDDVVGPMINRQVVVDVYQSSDGSYFFRDIQPAE